MPVEIAADKVIDLDDFKKEFEYRINSIYDVVLFHARILCKHDDKELRRRMQHGGFSAEIREQLAGQIPFDLSLRWAIEDLTEAVNRLREQMINS